MGLRDGRRDFSTHSVHLATVIGMRAWRFRLGGLARGAFAVAAAVVTISSVPDAGAVTRSAAGVQRLSQPINCRPHVTDDDRSIQPSVVLNNGRKLDTRGLLDVMSGGSYPSSFPATMTIDASVPGSLAPGASGRVSFALTSTIDPARFKEIRSLVGGSVGGIGTRFTIDVYDGSPARFSAYQKPGPWPANGGATLSGSVSSTVTAGTAPVRYALGTFRIIIDVFAEVPSPLGPIQVNKIAFTCQRPASVGPFAGTTVGGVAPKITVAPESGSPSSGGSTGGGTSTNGTNGGSNGGSYTDTDVTVLASGQVARLAERPSATTSNVAPAALKVRGRVDYTG